MLYSLGRVNISINTDCVSVGLSIYKYFYANVKRKLRLSHLKMEYPVEYGPSTNNSPRRKGRISETTSVLAHRYPTAHFGSLEENRAQTKPISSINISA